MNRTASSTIRVADLRKGDKVADAIFLVETANFKQTRNQKYFIQMSLRDSSGIIKAIRWEATSKLYESFGVDDFLQVNGRVEEFQGQLQLIVDGFERVESNDVDFTKFLPASEFDLDELEKELDQAVAEVHDPQIRELLRRIVESPEIRAGLRRCPAGKALHHAYLGGLLEHICSLLRASRSIAELYTELNRDLLYAGAILHDIGKVRELSYTSNFRYTDSGQLLGHIGLGLVLVNDMAREVPHFPKDKLLQIQHIVASHHGIPEYGALKLPMTAEAIAFHYLDNLDAKMATVRAVEKELPRDEDRGGNLSKWSDFKPHLNRKLYFPGKED